MAKAISSSTRLALSRLTEKERKEVRESIERNPIAEVCHMCLRECTKGNKVCRECSRSS